MGKFVDRIGIYYGYTMAMNYKGKDKHGNSIWECLCNCGKTHEVAGNNLQSGHTKSCGCYRRIFCGILGKLSGAKNSANSRTHGKTGTRAHQTWKNMKTRCTNKKSKDYKNWGGRGITYCKEWEKFENFLFDMCASRGLEDIPEGLTLDRVDNNLGYYNENCRLATQKEQQNNRRNNKKREKEV